MSDDPLFGSKEPVVGSDQDTDASLEAIKTKFTKEDGTIDTDALLKKALNADLHIPKIESENANLRKKVDESLTYQDLLNKINAQRESASSGSNQDPNERDDPRKEITEKDLEAMADKVFSKRQQEAAQAANVQYVAQELTKVWGKDFPDRLRQKGNQLGISEARIRAMAMDEPKVLLALALPAAKEVDNTYVPPQTTTRTSHTTNNTRNWAYYKAMMKNDPKRYNSQAVVNEMHEMAHKLGADFYN